MPKFMHLARWTAENRAAVRAEGFAGRVAGSAAVAESVGGTVESLYFPNSGEWDAIVIFDAPSTDADYAVVNMALSSGKMERYISFELRTADQADAALAQQVATSWPKPA